MARPEILAVVQGSPIEERTRGLVSNLVQQGRELAKIVVVTAGSWRSRLPEEWGGMVSLAQREAAWGAQVLRVVSESGCRWLVGPSYVDRYLPGAFATVAATGANGDHTVIGPSLVRHDGRLKRVGPDPFSFDLFRLMFRQNYIAPGAAFLSAARFLANRGFDTRFPTAAVLEYLLRTGAGDGVQSLSQPLLETEITPFLGVPPEYAARYAKEAALVVHEVNRVPFTPASAAGILVAIAEATRHPDHSFAFGNGLGELARRWRETVIGSVIEDLGLPLPVVATAPAPTPAPSRATLDPPPTRRLQVRGALRALTPAPVWNALRRLRRARRAFTEPLELINDPGSAAPRFVQVTWGVRALTPVPVLITLRRLWRAWRGRQ